MSEPTAFDRWWSETDHLDWEDDRQQAKAAYVAAVEACVAELDREAAVCQRVADQSTDRTIRSMNGGAALALRKMATKLREMGR